MSSRTREQHSFFDAQDASAQLLDRFALTDGGSLEVECELLGVKEASFRLWREGRVCLHGNRIQQELKDASSQPPVERDELDSLDVKKLENSMRVRHDLNYATHLVLSLQPKNQQQLEDASRYHSAVVLELVLFLTNNSTQSCCSCTGRSSLADQQPQLNRLPGFVDTIRQLVKDVVREEHCNLVDDVMDVDLMMDQLKNGCCDLLALAEWLGLILKQSCSPTRDAQIDGTINLIMTAVETRDCEALTFGIASLFEVFETLKLVSLAPLCHLLQ